MKIRMHTMMRRGAFGKRFIAAALLLVAAASLTGAGRFCASYFVTIDAVSSGGGAASSTSYSQPDGVVGQAACATQSAGGSWRNDSGVVQPCDSKHSAVTDWRKITH